jgi:hypothetical protein
VQLDQNSLPDCKTLAYQMRSAYSQVVVIAQFGLCAYKLHAIIFCSRETDGIVEINGLHHRRKVMITISPVTQDIEC